jgi:hypothetical protein
MQQVKISFLSSSNKSETVCIRCRIFAGSGRLEDFVDLLLLHRECSACYRHCATICTFRIAPRPGRERDSTGGATRKIRGDAGAITTASETTAQFLVIRLWTSVHVVENKANRMANSLLDFESQRA